MQETARKCRRIARKEIKPIAQNEAQFEEEERKKEKQKTKGMKMNNLQQENEKKEEASKRSINGGSMCIKFSLSKRKSLIPYYEEKE